MGHFLGVVFMKQGQQRTYFLVGDDPRSSVLTEYMNASASSSVSERLWPGPVLQEMPIDTLPFMAFICLLENSSFILLARLSASFLSVLGSSSTNSSPPQRAIMSSARHTCLKTRPEL
jgi:hypothetical protein